MKVVSKLSYHDLLTIVLRVRVNMTLLNLKFACQSPSPAPNPIMWLCLSVHIFKIVTINCDIL